MIVLLALISLQSLKFSIVEAGAFVGGVDTVKYIKNKKLRMKRQAYKSKVLLSIDNNIFEDCEQISGLLKEIHFAVDD
jgi:hypothetical protein